MKQARYITKEGKEVTYKQWLKLSTSVLIVVTWKHGWESYLFKTRGAGVAFYNYLDLWRGLKKDKYKYEPLDVEYAIKSAEQLIEYYKDSEEYQRNKDRIESIEVRTFSYKERMEMYKVVD